MSAHPTVARASGADQPCCCERDVLHQEQPPCLAVSAECAGTRVRPQLQGVRVPLALQQGRRHPPSERQVRIGHRPANRPVRCALALMPAAQPGGRSGTSLAGKEIAVLWLCPWGADGIA